MKTLTVPVYPKITQNELNDQLIIKHRKSAPKLRTCSELKCLKTLRIDSTWMLNKYLFFLRIWIIEHYPMKYFCVFQTTSIERSS